MSFPFKDGGFLLAIMFCLEYWHFYGLFQFAGSNKVNPDTILFNFRYFLRKSKAESCFLCEESHAIACGSVTSWVSELREQIFIKYHFFSLNSLI